MRTHARNGCGAGRKGAGRPGQHRAKDIFDDPHPRARDMLVEVEQPGNNPPMVDRRIADQNDRHAAGHLCAPAAARRTHRTRCSPKPGSSIACKGVINDASIKTFRAFDAGLEHQDDGEGDGDRRRIWFFSISKTRSRRRRRKPRAKTPIEALRDLRLGKESSRVRVNGADTHWAHDDVIEVVEGAGEYLDVIIVPKPKAPRDIWFFDTLLTQLETKLHLKNKIGLEALIEESAALARVEEIAASSPRLEALILGFGDLSASQGMRFGVASDPAHRYPGDMWHHARVRMITACRANGIDAIDGPVRQLQGSRRLPARGDLGGDARRGRQMGDSSEPDRTCQRRLRADAAGNRKRAQNVGSLRGGDARRRRRGGRGRDAGRRGRGANLRGRAGARAADGRA